MTKGKKYLQTVLATFLFILISSPWIKSYCITNEEMMAKFEEMAKKIEAQQKLIEELQSTVEALKGPATTDNQEHQKPASPVIVANRAEVKQVVTELLAESDPLPKWLKGLEYGGDFRLRYEGIINRTDRDDRHRTRFRLRLALSKQLTEEIKLLLRFASATGNTITTSNQSFDDAFDKKDFWIDQAYVVYQPNFFPGLELAGGKFKNPFVHTDIIWDSDLNQEGAYQRYTFNLTPHVKPFITLGQMAIYENDRTRDATLVAYQIGFDWQLGQNKWTLAATYYDYINLEDSQLVRDGLAHGNTTKSRGTGEGLASDFDLVNVTSFWNTQVFDIPLTIFSDFVKNIASDNDTQDYGYAFGFTLGNTKNKGDWSIGYKYARIEPDATVGAFNDANFGFSNRRGSKVWLKYQLHAKVLLGPTVYITDSVRGADDEMTDVLLDLLFKF